MVNIFFYVTCFTFTLKRIIFVECETFKFHVRALLKVPHKWSIICLVGAIGTYNLRFERKNMFIFWLNSTSSLPYSNWKVIYLCVINSPTSSRILNNLEKREEKNIHSTPRGNSWSSLLNIVSAISKLNQLRNNDWMAQYNQVELVENIT